MLEDGRTNINQSNKNGDIPLHGAVLNYHKAVAKLLLRYMPDCYILSPKLLNPKQIQDVQKRLILKRLIYEEEICRKNLRKCKRKREDGVKQSTLPQMTSFLMTRYLRLGNNSSAREFPRLLDPQVYELLLNFNDPLYGQWVSCHMPWTKRQK